MVRLLGNPYNAAGQPRDVALPAIVPYRDDMKFPNASLPGVFLHNPQRFLHGRAKALLCMYCAFDGVEALDLTYNDPSISNLLNIWREEYPKQFGITSDGKFNPHMTSGSLLTHARMVNKEWVDATMSKEEWNGQLRDDELPEWYDATTDQADVERYWLNVIAGLLQINQSLVTLGHDFEAVWRPVEYRCGVFAAETWWRLYAFTRSCEFQVLRKSDRSIGLDWTVPFTWYTPREDDSSDMATSSETVVTTTLSRDNQSQSVSVKINWTTKQADNVQGSSNMARKHDDSKSDVVPQSHKKATEATDSPETPRDTPAKASEVPITPKASEAPTMPKVSLLRRIFTMLGAWPGSDNEAEVEVNEDDNAKENDKVMEDDKVKVEDRDKAPSITPATSRVRTPAVKTPAAKTPAATRKRKRDEGSSKTSSSKKSKKFEEFI